MSDKNRFFIKCGLLLLFFAVLDRSTASLLRFGLDRHLGLDRVAQVICIGHSHTKLGIDRSALEHGVGVPVIKYAVMGANVYDRLAMLQHYFSIYPDSSKVVVYDVDDHLFNSDGLSANSYKLLYPYIDNNVLAEYFQNNAGSGREILVRRLVATLRYNTQALNMAVRGLMDRDDNLKYGSVNIEALKENIRFGRQAPIIIEPQAVRCLEETIRLVRSHGAKLILLSIPTVDVLNDMTPIKRKQVLELLKSYQQLDSGVLFLDYNPRYSGRYELFSDPVHLNSAGCKLVTSDLISDIQGLLQQ